jgi:Leucine-rich repeat (LRR) protein
MVPLLHPILDLESCNQLSDVGGLSSLVRLHTLSLSSCALSDVRPLSLLVDLRTLDLSFCSRCDTSPLSALASVRIRLA